MSQFKVESLPIVVHNVSFNVYYNTDTKKIVCIYGSTDVHGEVDLHDVLSDDVLDAISYLIKNWG